MRYHDHWLECLTRTLARTTSRRSALALVGGAITGSALVPVLPIARAAEPNGSGPQDPGDPTSCDYWRYCGIDGFLCACCGGTATSCPPGTEMSPITWIGTCHNPADGRSYMISYNDCCGKASCGSCGCNRNESDRPMVRPQSNNDINWCLGTKSSVYNCSTAIIVGVDTETR